MPMLELRVAMVTSQQPQKTALPAKQRPEAMPIRGARPLSWAKARKVGTSRPVTPTPSVSPGRPPPPSANQMIGSRSRSASAIIRSVFLWFMVPWVPARTV